MFCLTCSQTLEITTEPSPTAEATRFTDPARTSPTAQVAKLRKTTDPTSDRVIMLKMR